MWCGHMIVRPARLIQSDYWKFSFMWSTRTWQRLSSSVSSRTTLHLSLWAIFQICFYRFYKQELLYSTVKRDRREVVCVSLFLANPKPLMTSLRYIPDTPDQEFPSESQQPFLQVSQNLHECINIHLWVSEYSPCHAELFHTAVLLKGKSVRPSVRPLYRSSGRLQPLAIASNFRSEGLTGWITADILSKVSTALMKSKWDIFSLCLHLWAHLYASVLVNIDKVYLSDLHIFTCGIKKTPKILMTHLALTGVY